MPHTIRLRGPWQICSDAPAAGSESPTASRLTMPCRVAELRSLAAAGQVILERRFQAPTGLTTNSCVLLVIDDASAASEATIVQLTAASLNREPLAMPTNADEQVADSAVDGTSLTFNIGHLLQPSNLLRLCADVRDHSATAPSDLPAENRFANVRLEITD